jgi:hypothetical protein
MRSRILVAIVALGLMAAGTGSVIASEGGGTTQASSNAAKSQYVPAKCNPPGAKSNCSCPDHSELEYNGETRNIECACPSGSSFNEKGNQCECPNGHEMLNKGGKESPYTCSCPPNQEVVGGECVHRPPPPHCKPGEELKEGKCVKMPPPPPGCPRSGEESHYCQGNNLNECTKYCQGNNNSACREHCIGNNNSKCTEFCDGNNNPQCTRECKGSNNPKCKEACSKEAAYVERTRTPVYRRLRPDARAASRGLALSSGRIRVVRT